MILSSLLSAGALTLAAQAFVLPDAVVPEANSLREADSHPHVFNLDCSNCPYALNSQRNGGHEWTTNVKTDLEMKFATEDNTLKFNDVPFYPIQNPTLPPTLYVSQKKKEGEASAMEAYEGMLRLSYSMEYDERKLEDNSVVVILMTIMGLDGEMVKVDNVEIRAIKEADGKVSIRLHGSTLKERLTSTSSLSSKLIPSHPPQTRPTPNARTFSAASLPSSSLA